MGKRFLTGLLLIVWLMFGIGAGASDESPNKAVGETPSNALVDGKAEQTVPMTDIHGIKPLEPAGFDPAPILYGISGAALLAFAALSFWIWKHRRKRLRLRTVPGLSPEETALGALGELVDVERMDGKAFYFRLSAVLRNYLQRRFGINGPEMTTEELLPEIGKLDIEKELRRELKTLLQTVDPIKFAGFPASVRGMEAHLAFAGRFVRETTPKAADQD